MMNVVVVFWMEGEIEEKKINKIHASHNLFLYITRSQLLRISIYVKIFFLFLLKFHCNFVCSGLHPRYLKALANASQTTIGRENVAYDMALMMRFYFRYKSCWEIQKLQNGSDEKETSFSNYFSLQVFRFPFTFFLLSFFLICSHFSAFAFSLCLFQYPQEGNAKQIAI